MTLSFESCCWNPIAVHYKPGPLQFGAQTRGKSFRESQLIPTLKFYYNIKEPEEVSRFPKVRSWGDQRQHDRKHCHQVVAGLLRGSQTNTRWHPTIRPPKFASLPHEYPNKFRAQMEPFLVYLETTGRGRPITRRYCCLVAIIWRNRRNIARLLATFSQTL